MRSLIITILLLAFASQPAIGVVLRGHFTDFDGNPIPDVMAFVDCRENYFFTDQDGIVLTYVEPGHADCAVSASRDGYMVRYCLATIEDAVDTVDYLVTLVREGEPEYVVPCSDQSRFARIESCGGLTDWECSGEMDRTTTLMFNSKSKKRRSCIFTLSHDEEILLGSDGYDLENVEKIEFLARSQSGNLDVTFFSLADDCDSPIGTYPSLDATLTVDYVPFEISLTRWNRLTIQSIWGCTIRDAGKAAPPVVEIKDLSIIFIPPPTASASAASQN